MLASLIQFFHIILAPNTHEQKTRFASHGLLTKPACNTSKYGTNGFPASPIASWNFFQNKFSSKSQTDILFSTQTVDSELLFQLIQPNFYLKI